MRRSHRLGADLVVFPELCLTGYPPRDLLSLHGFVDCQPEGARRDRIRRSDEHRRRLSVSSTATGADKGGNSSTLRPSPSTAGSSRCTTRCCCPTYDVFDEDRYFQEGLENNLVRFQGRPIGVSICEDAWNAEDFWPKRMYPIDPIRFQVEKGAELLINISASPFEMHKPAARFRMLSEHVRKHRVPLLYVNLVGGNDDILFDGNSLAPWARAET